jgi:F-type H+-transporting ATPase subunit b
MVLLGTAPLIGVSWTMLMVFISFFVLYLILKKYFFEKVRNFMQAREQKVIDAFDNADQANKVANDRLEDLNGKLASIDEQANEILKESKQKADARAEEIIKEAQAEVDLMKEKAQKDIEREQAKAIAELREQVAMLAVYAAERIIMKQLDPSEQQSVISSAIEEVGKSQWLN